MPRESWEDLLGARGWGHLYRSSYRSKTVPCAGEIRRSANGSWECGACSEPCTVCEGSHAVTGTAENDTRHGELRHAATWTLKYSHNGEGPFYERTRTADWNKAQAYKRRRFREIFGGADPWAKKSVLTLSSVLEFVLAHYRKNKLKSITRPQNHIRNLLKFSPFMKGAIDANAVTETMLNDGYVDFRQAAGMANATINLELGTLRQGFKLAYKRRDEHGRRLVERPPVVELLKPGPPRESFFTTATTEAMLAALRAGHSSTSPEDVADLAEFYWIIGWRNAAARAIERTDVDWFSQEIIMRRVLSKNGEPVRVPFGTDPQLRALVQRRERLAVSLEQAHGVKIPWLFFRRGPKTFRGKPIRQFLRAWNSALKRAGLAMTGPGRLTPHAFRRSAARDMMDALGDPLLACERVGWNSLLMLKRYRITNRKDRERAAEKLAEYRQGQRESAQLALPFAKRSKRD